MAEILLCFVVLVFLFLCLFFLFLRLMSDHNKANNRLRKKKENKPCQFYCFSIELNKTKEMGLCVFCCCFFMLIHSEFEERNIFQTIAAYSFNKWF